VKNRAMHYFACVHTARGFYDLLDSNLEGVRALFVLKDAPNAVITPMMQETGAFWEEKGYAVEYLHSPTDNAGMIGVIVPGLAAAVDFSFFHSNERVRNFRDKTVIGLKRAFAFPSTPSQKSEALRIGEEIANELAQVHENLADALEVHDDWEAIYIRRLDHEAANRLTEELIRGFYGDRSANKKPVVKHRFLGAATPKGAVDFIPDLTGGLSRRFLLKGRPGTGKSTMLAKLALEGQKRGFDVEVYHCGFDPKSLDMVIVRELGTAVFDSTSPHEYFPGRDGDEVVDVYAAAVKGNTDEIYEDELRRIKKRYKEKIGEARAHLAKVKALNDVLCGLYAGSADSDTLRAARAELRREMTALVPKWSVSSK